MDFKKNSKRNKKHKDEMKSTIKDEKRNDLQLTGFLDLKVIN